MVDLSQELKDVLGVETEYDVVCYCMDLFALAEQNTRNKKRKKAIVGEEMVGEIDQILKERISLSVYKVQSLRQIAISVIEQINTKPEGFDLVLMRTLPDGDEQSKKIS